MVGNVDSGPSAEDGCVVSSLETPEETRGRVAQTRVDEGTVPVEVPGALTVGVRNRELLLPGKSWTPRLYPEYYHGQITVLVTD